MDTARVFWCLLSALKSCTAPVETDQAQQALHDPVSPWSLGPVAFPWLDLKECHADHAGAPPVQG
ncbi:hypothetical protein NHU_03149 [Rhodovulum sulfidophilum]|uniref:Uncharacterized protein n=1 Tax=Rhodovulum sulfidophilum TaxID=35806 RepID=A0A0D6B5B2_RHOSU|nr:hypothetical protein NHU_03149 [Rhodovulum sulfidophilum]